MISANDVLHAISEIHQYSMLLLELKNSKTIIILRHVDGTASYYRFEGSFKSSERAALTGRISNIGDMKDLVPLTIGELIDEVDGKKTNHIWLEAVGSEGRERGFLSITELQNFLRSNPHSNR